MSDEAAKTAVALDSEDQRRFQEVNRGIEVANEVAEAFKRHVVEKYANGESALRLLPDGRLVRVP